MTPSWWRDKNRERVTAKVKNLDTGQEQDAEVLTEDVVRELRRRARRLNRSDQQIGLTVLRRSLRQLERGRLDSAVQSAMTGFGALIVKKVREKLTK